MRTQVTHKTCNHPAKTKSFVRQFIEKYLGNIFFIKSIIKMRSDFRRRTLGIAEKLDEFRIGCCFKSFGNIRGY